MVERILVMIKSFGLLKKEKERTLVTMSMNKVSQGWQIMWSCCSPSLINEVLEHLFVHLSDTRLSSSIVRKLYDALQL